MPNWCNNDLNLYHEDPEMINRAEAALKEGRLFSEFVPCPKELSDTVAGGGWEGYEKELNEFKQALNVKYFGYKDWYSFNLSRWGTKWDACEPCVIRVSDDTLSVSFDTAWSPPIAFYEAITELGFVVKALYYESGMSFCGSWDDGIDEYFNIEGNSDWVEENIPSEIDQAFCISESMAEWEEQEKEEQA